MERPNRNPNLIFSDSKKGFGDIEVNIDYFEAEKEETEKILYNLTEEFSNKLKEKVISELDNILTFANFLGEAELYMSQNNIRYSKSIREQYAKAIYKDFISSLDQTIQYDKEQHCVYISPYIFSLEFGDFYRPAVGFISKCLEAWSKKLETVT